MPKTPIKPHSTGGHARFVTVKKAGELFGLSECAVRKRIERGHWCLGKQYRKAPDGRIMIDVPAVEHWVQE